MYRFLILSPIFFFSVRHWMNIVVLLFFIFSLFYIKKTKNINNNINGIQLLCIISLVGPFFSILISQLIRGEFYPPNFDNPLRILMCAPIFYAVSEGWLIQKNEKSIAILWATVSLPLALIFTTIFFPSWRSTWGVNQFTTYFVDLLSFGNLTLLFSLLTLLGLSWNLNILNQANKIICITGIILGILLSIKSGTRTGWLALPAYMLIWFFFVGRSKFTISKSISFLLLKSLIVVILAQANPLFIDKIYLAINQLMSYKWDGVFTSGSADGRITFARMGAFYFWQRPFAGWGDTGWLKMIDSIDMSYYTTESIRLIPLAGFHNEIITNSVRSGIWGLSSSLILFFTPIYLSIKFYQFSKFTALFLFYFTLHQFLAGLTTEVTNLTFLSSFFGFFISVLLGELLYKIKYSKLTH